jgi:hypothetical protein
MRFVLRLYLLWPRLELALVAFLPLGLILESSIANASAYGFAGFSTWTMAAASLVALLRGFFFEVLTYVSTRTVAIMVRKGAREHRLALVIMVVLSFFLVLVSAVNNLGWVLAGHDLVGMFTLLGRLLPPLIYKPYQVGLAVLLPLAVGGIALVDLDHFVHDLLEKDQMDNHAVLVEERIMHRTAFLKSQRAQASMIREAYGEIAEDRAQAFIDQVRSGDLTFGSGSSGSTVVTGSLIDGRPTQLLGPVSSSGSGMGRVWPVNP